MDLSVWDLTALLTQVRSVRSPKHTAFDIGTFKFKFMDGRSTNYMQKCKHTDEGV